LIFIFFAMIFEKLKIHKRKKNPSYKLWQHH
jgi:hypothetical protein